MEAMQQLQAADRVWGQVLRLQRLDLQPPADWIIFLLRPMLGGARTDDAASRCLG